MRFAHGLIGAAAVAAVVLGGSAARPATPAVDAGLAGARLVSAPLAFRTTVLTAGGARELAGQQWRGGPYSTSTGEVVTVYVSATYADPDEVGRRWAGFFASLEHGSELAALRAYLAPLAEVQAACGGGDVLGCYGGGRLVTVGDPIGSGLAPESIAAHEYGHHVAAHRANPPWSAVDWGTKRWASYVGVCGRAAAGTAYPGDESANYALNPGEAFAETYRVLSELRGGAKTFGWPIVDASFSPDEAALRLVDEDVAHPYAPPAATLVRARFAPRQRVWRRSLPTPLDGVTQATLRLPPGAGHELTLAGDGGRVLARGFWTGAGRKSLRYTICGQRSLTIRVERHGVGRFTLEVTRP